MQFAQHFGRHLCGWWKHEQTIAGTAIEMQAAIGIDSAVVQQDVGVDVVVVVSRRWSGHQSRAPETAL